jgi:hypothetical protein
MSTTSYKPNNQEASNNVNIVRFTPEQQQHKTPDQLNLNLCDFMMEGIGTMTQLIWSWGRRSMAVAREVT